MKTANPKKGTTSGLVFDHHMLRLIVGCIAFLFPWIVIWVAGTVTSSISSSYHTNARDIFVGLLFIIGALFVAYKGHTPQEDLISTVGGVAAVVTALSPTARDGYEMDLKAWVHSIGAVTLFSAVVYFCLFAFMRQAFAKLDVPEKFTFWRAVRYAGRMIGGQNLVAKVESLRRLRFYLICGVLIAIIMVASVFASQMLKSLDITFWAETVALGLFGFSWMLASQIFPWFTEEEKRYKLF